MKLLIMLALFSGLATQAFAATCGGAAKQGYLLAIDRFKVGELTRVDVAEAEYFYKMELYNCSSTTDPEDKTLFCFEAYAATATVYFGVLEYFKIGERNSHDVAKAKERMEKTWERCTQRK